MRHSTLSWLGLALAVVAFAASTPAFAQGVTTAAINAIASRAE